MILVRPPHVRAVPVRNEHPTDLPEQFAGSVGVSACVNAKDRHTAGYDRPKPDPGSLRPSRQLVSSACLPAVVGRGRSLLDGHSHRVAGSLLAVDDGAQRHL